MVETKCVTVNSREIFFGLFIFLSLALGILDPFAAPGFGLVLLVTGIYAYRHATDVTMRTIAVAAITSGIVMFIIIIVFWFFFMTSNINGTYSIEKYPGR